MTLIHTHNNTFIAKTITEKKGASQQFHYMLDQERINLRHALEMRQNSLI